MKPLEQCQLYTFIDTAYLRGREAAAVAVELCRGGSDLIQLRGKDCSADQIRRMALEVLPVLREAGVGLVVNDFWEVACEVGADFCHLGQEDFFGAGLTSVDQLPGTGKRPRIGLSTHAPEQAARALAAGPDYIAIGPVYATGTKPTARPVTLEYVRWAAEHVKIPWFAIGGITLGNLEEVRKTGAERICVVSAILNAPDVAGACREFEANLRE
jgi:thiamine-phosphate pyrophosphorylase